MAITNLQSSPKACSLYNVEEDLDRLKKQAKSLELFDKEILAEIISRLSRNKNDTIQILDVGCADGQLTVSRFSDYDNIHVLAIDKSAKAIEKAKESHKISHIDFLVCDILDNHLLGSQFDFIFCSYVLPHVFHKKEFLDILWSFLMPKGAMLMRAGSDFWKSTYPSSRELEWILKETKSIPGISDRECGNKIPSYLQSLTPAAQTIQAVSMLESTLGYSPEQKVDFFLKYYGFRKMYIDKALGTSTNEELRKLKKMQKYLHLEEQRFFKEINLFSTVLHVSFIAYK